MKFKKLILSGGCLGVVMATQARAENRPSDAQLVGIFDAWLEACKPNAPSTYRAEVLEFNKLPDKGDEAYSRAHYKAKHNASRTLELKPHTGAILLGRG